MVTNKNKSETAIVNLIWTILKVVNIVKDVVKFTICLKNLRRMF